MIYGFPVRQEGRSKRHYTFPQVAVWEVEGFGGASWAGGACDPCAVRLDDSPNLAKYKLRDTFDNVFVVFYDTAWRERGVLLVWASERDPERHSCGVRNNHEYVNNSDDSDRQV